MKKIVIMLVCLSLAASAAPLFGADDKNKAKYEKRYSDPVLKALEEAREKQQAVLDAETAQIRKRQAEEKKKEREPARNLQSDMTGVNPPPSPAACQPLFHFPPVAQYNTNICWSFAATSFYESEIFRLSGKKIKLSEVWTVYHEYLAKVRRFVQRARRLAGGRGRRKQRHQPHLEGARHRPGRGLPRPPRRRRQAGPRAADQRGAKRILDYVKKNDLWDEKVVLAHVAVILDKHLGAPPQKFVFNGKEMTPLEFLANETPLNMDDYVDVMSTSYYPFYTFQEFAVPDNWWHSKEYLNVPLDEWYAPGAQGGQGRLHGGHRRRRLRAGQARLPGRLLHPQLRHPGRLHRPGRARVPHRQPHHRGRPRHPHRRLQEATRATTGS